MSTTTTDPEELAPIVFPDPETSPLASEPEPGAGDTLDPEVDAPDTVTVIVDGRNRRTDDDALEGGFANVVSGPHAGRFGALMYVTERGEDGYPTKCVLRTRDAYNQFLAVDYADLRPSGSNGGR